MDEETGKIITSGEEAQRIIEEYYNNEKEILEKEISKLKSEIYKKKELLSKNRKKSTVEDILNSFPKNDIEDIARENAVVLKSKTKSAMAFELARAILEPDFMRKKLVVSSEKEIKAFESAMEKGCYYPEDDEIALLDSFIENIFVGYFEDGMIEVPEEVKCVYAVLQRTNYKEYHQKAHWLYKCMDAFCRINVVASEDVLYKMYQQNCKIDNSHEAYESLLANFPDEYKIVCFKDGLVFDSNILKNKMYLKIRNTQRIIDDYIPTKDWLFQVTIIHQTKTHI